MKIHLKDLAEEFVESLGESLRSKILLKLELYEEYGLRYMYQSGYLKKFSDGLYEIIVLRDYRFLGTMIHDNFFLVIGFRKKSQKTPRRMVQHAVRKIKELTLH